MKAVLLGPHPGHGAYSIGNYFSFYRAHLPLALPDWEIVGRSPGPAAPAGTKQGRARICWDNFVTWPVQLNHIRGDLIHILDQGLAWYGDFLKGGKRLISVHDLINYMIWKGWLDFGHTSSRRRVLLSRCANQIKRADHIVSVSQCTADHLITLLNVAASKITVVPNVIESSFLPLTPEEWTTARARWFKDSEHVVIHVGTASVYKNRIGVLRAFRSLRQRLPGVRLFLVHGPPSVEEAAFLAEANLEKTASFLPPLSQPELREFYGAADALIFPSLYEGFGWPPLEAMSCGCPVVCTTRGSLKEVVCDAALTVDDPHDHSTLAEQVRTVLTDDGVACQLRERGLVRVKRFAPSAIVPLMAQVYRTT